MAAWKPTSPAPPSRATATDPAPTTPAACLAVPQRANRPLSPRLDRHADRLARGLAVIINILDPDAIVLGGGLSNMAHLYTELPRRIPGHAFSDTIATPILRNKHGNSSGVRGAAWLWPA